jgi:hypothetical protein
VTDFSFILVLGSLFDEFRNAIFAFFFRIRTFLLFLLGSAPWIASRMFLCALGFTYLGVAIDAVVRAFVTGVFVTFITTKMQVDIVGIAATFDTKATVETVAACETARLADNIGTTNGEIVASIATLALTAEVQVTILRPTPARARLCNRATALQTASIARLEQFCKYRFFELHGQFRFMFVDQCQHVVVKIHW